MGYNHETGLYTIDCPKFDINVREFTRTAQEYKRNERRGNPCYTLAHPVYDKREYDAFWDEEERRRREGYSVGGVSITGEHYGFLNFAQILRTTDIELVGIEKENVRQRKVGKKELIFPDFWDGHYKWFHAKKTARELGLHVVGGKSRRKGFSYVGGWSSFNNYDLYPARTSVIGAFDNKYLLKGDGTMTMAKRYANFINLHTDWRKSRLVNLKDQIKSGYKLKGRDEERGFLSQILAISFKDNPDAAAGKDAYEIQLEELGIFPNLEKVLEITLPILEDGDVLTGQFIGWGTGGTKGANWEAFEKVYYNPRAYRCMAFEDEWEREAPHEGGVGFFFPFKQNLVPYIDEFGNSLIEESEKACEYNRAEKKKYTTDVADFDLYIGQRANTHTEAFSRSSTNIFSSKELTDHINKIKHDPLVRNLPRYGIMVRTGNGIRLATNEELDAQKLEWHPALLHHPFKANEDVSGCWIEWQPPYVDSNGRIPKGLYRVWNDPYATDKDKKDISIKHSLAATYIYERPNTFTPSRGDILVAAYVGRPAKMDEYNEQLFRGCEYYGGEDGILMFENNRGDVKPFAQRTHRIQMLADEPEMNFKRELAPTTASRVKGITINPARKGTGAIYLRDWLYNVRGLDESGEKKMNLHYIYDLGLLQELEKFNLNGNFDRISCMIVGMYDMKEEFDKEIESIGDKDLEEFFSGTDLFRD